LRVTICGHACLLVETTDNRILIDPVFSRSLADGAMELWPRRSLRFGSMPRPTILVITHAHFDHFDPPTLARFPRSLPVVVPDDARLIQQLRALGFAQIEVLQPWQPFRVGATVLEATPSEHAEPEFGLLIRDDTGSFWNMGDAEVRPWIGERLHAAYGPIDVATVKFQPGTPTGISYLRGLGPTFNKAEVFDSFEAACTCAPRLVIPYALGMRFRGRHAWYNRYAFPLSAEEAARLLQARLGAEGRATSVLPGDVVEISREEVQHQAQRASFVRAIPGSSVRWEPIETRTLAGLASEAERRDLKRRFEAFLADPFGPWLQAELNAADSPETNFIFHGVVWQFVIHAGAGVRFTYSADFRQPEIRLQEGEHPEANYFLHVSGKTLLGVLQGAIHGKNFWVAGDVRFYEKIMQVRDGRFCAPAPGWELFDHLADPVTYYLRHPWRDVMSKQEFGVAMHAD
jgi:hypothetical protein